MNIKGSKKKNQLLSVNIFEQQEIIAKADAIKAELKHLPGMSWKPKVSLTKTISFHSSVMTC